MRFRLCSALAVAVFSTPLGAQAAPQQARQADATPGTKMEAFQPAAGTLLTVGYTEVGKFLGISVDAREMRGGTGSVVRGLVVEVTESQYRQERSFIDADEVAELIAGANALLQISANPTAYRSFEVRYKTRGALELTAFNNQNGAISYALQVGRITKAQTFMTAPQMTHFRDLLVEAQQALANASPPSR